MEVLMRGKFLVEDWYQETEAQYARNLVFWEGFTRCSDWLGKTP